MAEQFQAQQLALAESTQTLPFLDELKKQGLTAFSKAAMPTRKTEAWRFTSLFNLASSEYAKASNSGLNEELTQAATIADLNAARLVFVNGFLDRKSVV